jgi:FkbM family methyltransferase
MMSTSLLQKLKRRVNRKLRIVANRDVSYRIGAETIVLPPKHWLQVYQEEFHLYDRYFLEFLRRYALQSGDLCVIDIGANVGDTAAAVLSVAPNAKVISVEGSPYFLKYLRRNAQGRTSIRIVDGFVTSKPGSWSYVGDGSTGHLVEKKASDQSLPKGTRYFTPAEILALAGDCTTRVWKSDTDGYDIPILLGSFDEIVRACEVVWIEFDPLGNLSDSRDIDALLLKISELSRDMVIFDNFGHRMLQIRAKDAPSIVPQLNSWLAAQKAAGERRIYYFDMWLLPRELADLLSQTSSEVADHR